MKRSEMVELIVSEALSWDGLNTSGVPLKEIANDVLKVCEKMGMLPPTISKNDVDVLTTDGKSINLSVNIHEWETE